MKIKNIKIFQLTVMALSFGFFYLIKLVQAVALGGLNDTANETGIGYKTSLGSNDITTIIGTTINYILALLGGIFMILIWMGAFDIIGAGGNEETVKKGKNRIKNGAIGVLIILSAFLVTKLILSIIKGEEVFLIG